MNFESKSEFDECLSTDNLAEFNRIWGENDINEMTDLLLGKLSNIALFGSIAIFNQIFTLEAVTQYFSDAKARKSFLDTVLGHSSLPLVNRMFDIKLFRDEIIQDPFSRVLALATNRNCVPQVLAKIQQFTSVDQFIALKDNQIWFNAYVNYNYSAMNSFLEFPEVYAKVEALDPKHSQGPEYINTRFMEYYFAKLPQGELSEKEAKLAYLILLTLIRTYPDRDAIRNSVVRNAELEEDSRRSNSFFYRTSKAAGHWREKYVPNTTNVHAQRISALMSLPAVSRLARENNFSGTVNDVIKIVLTQGTRRARMVNC